MVLKDWKKSKKYDSDSFNIVKNVLPEFASFEDNYYLSYGFNGEVYWVGITKFGVTESKNFKSKVAMLNFVDKYMRSH